MIQMIQPNNAIQWCAWCRSMLPAIKPKRRRLTRVFVDGKYYCAKAPQDQFQLKHVYESCAFKAGVLKR